jgi:hypothetical protein
MSDDVCESCVALKQLIADLTSQKLLYHLSTAAGALNIEMALSIEG